VLILIVVPVLYSIFYKVHEDDEPKTPKEKAWHTAKTSWVGGVNIMDKIEIANFLPGNYDDSAMLSSSCSLIGDYVKPKALWTKWINQSAPEISISKLPISTWWKVLMIRSDRLIASAQQNLSCKWPYAFLRRAPSLYCYSAEYRTPTGKW